MGSILADEGRGDLHPGISSSLGGRTLATSASVQAPNLRKFSRASGRPTGLAPLPPSSSMIGSSSQKQTGQISQSPFDGRVRCPQHGQATRVRFWQMKPASGLGRPKSSIMMTRTTIRIQSSLLEAIRERANKNKRSFSKELEDVVRLGLVDRNEPREPIKLHVFTGGTGPAPGIDINDTSALLEICDEESDHLRRQRIDSGVS